MVQDVSIPLSWANNIPGVSGVEDVGFTVPQLSDIEDAVADVTFDLGDLETALEGDLGEAFADATPIDEIADAIIDPVVEELEEQLGIDFPSVEDISDQVVEDLEEATGIDFPDPGEFVEDVVDELEESLPEIQLDAEAVVEAFLDAVPVEDLPEITIAIEGSLFAVEQDLVEFVADVLAEVDILGALNLDQFLEDASELLPDGFIPTFDPVEAVTAAVAFVQRFGETIGAFIQTPNETAVSALTGFVTYIGEESGLVEDETVTRVAELAEAYD